MEFHMIRTWHPFDNPDGGYWSYAIYSSLEDAESDWPRIESGYKKAELLQGKLTVVRTIK